jgi:hypothetical protein
MGSILLFRQDGLIDLSPNMLTSGIGFAVQAIGFIQT